MRPELEEDHEAPQKCAYNHGAPCSVKTDMRFSNSDPGLPSRDPGISLSLACLKADCSEIASADWGLARDETRMRWTGRSGRVAGSRTAYGAECNRKVLRRGRDAVAIDPGGQRQRRVEVR